MEEISQTKRRIRTRVEQMKQAKEVVLIQQQSQLMVEVEVPQQDQTKKTGTLSSQPLKGPIVC